MPDGSVWAVPVRAVAAHRARYYAAEDGVPYEEAFAETVDLFLSSDDYYDVHDWAANNMDWDDVASRAQCVEDPGSVDYQEGWTNGDWEVVSNG